MAEHIESILANILNKRIRELGFDSLRKFHLAHRETIGVSYELLRQVMHAGRVPRIESLLRILDAANLPQPVVRNITARIYPKLLANAFPGGVPGGGDADDFPGAYEPGLEELQPSPPSDPLPAFPPGIRSREAIVRNLGAALSRIPLNGNEDLWDMASRLSEIAERKVRERARGRIDQPSLFGKEPEAIYQFLVRRGKAIPYLSRGEDWLLAFDGQVDYPDRFRGAILGQAIGAAMGRITQGLSAEDIQGLYGGIVTLPESKTEKPLATRRLPFNSAFLAHLAKNPRIDPEAIALAAAADIARQDATDGEIRFAANLGEQRFPWFESGEPVPESAAAARCVPIALLHAADYRTLKLETGIYATITHPNPASVAGAILLSVSIARFLHMRSGSLDPILFARSLAPLIAGIESERGGSRGRGLPSLARKVGTELPALLLRRAPIQEIRKAVGNGESPSEGIPFALACVLSNPANFKEAVLSAINSGNDAIRTGAMTGALSGALLGASSIPPEWKERLDGCETLEAAADALLRAATR